MAYVDRRTGIEIIERHECLELLASEELGRIGILDGAAPLVLPVNYALDGEAIIIRSGEGSKLAAARRSAACFEIDHHDRETHEGWSVVARGRLEEVSPYEGPALERLAQLPHPWAEGDRAHVLRLTIASLQGRRVRQRPAT
ncbi:MAG: pyridoxamine 5'-phosphate oxidase family protein [Acidimicrobiales bacterium]|nr:pyridoxamine 5'-phosphate oxidase family protein [Acidimicrobiales bacterium]